MHQHLYIDKHMHILNIGKLINLLYNDKHINIKKLLNAST